MYACVFMSMYEDVPAMGCSLIALTVRSLSPPTLMALEEDRYAALYEKCGLFEAAEALRGE